MAREVAQGGSHVQCSGTRVTRGGCKCLAAKIRHADRASRRVWRTAGWQAGCSVTAFIEMLSLRSGTGLALVCLHDRVCRQDSGGIFSGESTFHGTYCSDYLQVSPKPGLIMILKETSTLNKPPGNHDLTRQVLARGLLAASSPWLQKRRRAAASDMLSRLTVTDVQNPAFSGHNQKILQFDCVCWRRSASGQ